MRGMQGLPKERLCGRILITLITLCSEPTDHATQQGPDQRLTRARAPSSLAQQAELDSVFSFFQEHGKGGAEFHMLSRALQITAAKNAEASSNTKLDQAEFVTWLLRVTSVLSTDAYERVIAKIRVSSLMP